MFTVTLPADTDSLVARAPRGDEIALDALCARVRPMLVRHARRVLGRSADVEDAVLRRVRDDRVAVVGDREDDGAAGTPRGFELADERLPCAFVDEELR